MAGVMEMFNNFLGGNNNQQQQAQQQQQPNQQFQQQTNAPAGVGAVTPTGNPAVVSPNDPLAFQAGKQEGGEAPLANFAELWKIEPKDMPRDPVTALSPNFKIDPAKVAEAARSVDYARLIPQDLMAKALSGDANSMGAMLNTVVQAATANAGMSTAKIVEAALANQAQQFASILPQEVRKLQVSQAVVQDNPIFSNPAAAPMLDGLKAQFSAKYPTATPQQISDYTKQYLSDFIRAAGGTMPDPNVAAATAANKTAEPNWENFFGVKFQ